MTSMLQSIFVKDDTDILCVKVWGNEGHSVGEWGEVGVGDLVQGMTDFSSSIIIIIMDGKRY